MPSSSPFAERLRAAGYKATTARLQLLTLLEQAREPLSAPKLATQLRSKHVDPVTIYRTLNALTQAGLLRRINFHQGHALYELADAGDHHHAVCVKCHRVADVANCCVEADMHKNALQESGFASITQHSLEFFGVCKQCQ